MMGELFVEARGESHAMQKMHKSDETSLLMVSLKIPMLEDNTDQRQQ